MTEIKKSGFKVVFSLLIFAGALFASSCSNKSYPCPGLGQSDAADLSMFDENGKLKGNKKKARINKDTGIVNKKSPNKIRKQRRTKI
jgi:hypothetical protein